MLYKKKFKDYVPEQTFNGVSFNIEKIKDIIWARVKKRYPNRGKYWDEIYTVVLDDFLLNYDFEVICKIKEKVKNERG